MTGHLGATLSRIATRYGDLLYAAVPPDGAGDPGRAYLLTVTSLAAADHALDLGATPVPAALSASLPSTPLTAGAGADLLTGDGSDGLDVLLGDQAGNLYVYPYGGAQ
jgi:hypothetical protein